MSATRTIPRILIFTLAAAPAVAATPAPPEPVSPGGARVAALADRCPTFSWTLSGEAAGYELVVYRVGDEERQGVPAARTRLPAGAGSWTPAGGDCLEAGARYGWSVRNLGPAGPGRWSEPAVFEITTPSRREVTEALEVLRRYLDGGEPAAGEPEAPAPQRGGTAASERAEAREDPRQRRAAARQERTERLRAALDHPAAGETPSLTPKGHFSGTVAMHAVEPSTSGISLGVRGQSDSTQGFGVAGFATASSGSTRGLLGQSSSTQGFGVAGSATATSGSTRGISGLSQSTQGTGIWANASATSGTTEGVFGSSQSSQGTGVFGLAAAGEGATEGVLGQSESSAGTGVVGSATATTGLTRGVSGSSNSTEGNGVFGLASATRGTVEGVHGRSDSTEGTGVLGEATDTTGTTKGVEGIAQSTQGIGVLGFAETISGQNVGVQGRTNSSDGLAGEFLGDVDVTGTLTKGSNQFKIDHPLDPANRYLSHSVVESPDMKNVYDGVVRLGEDGAAWVELPEWFEALNRDFRYQLTPLRRPAPGLYVAQTIEGSRFRIAGGPPGLEVSWQVTGIRDDPYARDHPVQVEEDKRELRGRYLHPEAYDKPAELAIHGGEPGRSEEGQAAEAAPTRGEDE